MWRKGSLRALLVGRYIGAISVENSTEAPQKPKTRTAVRATNPTSGHLPSGNKSTSSQSFRHAHVHRRSICDSQEMETASGLSTNERMKKLSLSLSLSRTHTHAHAYTRTHMHTRTHTRAHTHTHTLEYYLAMKKNGILPFMTTWIDPEGTRLREMSQTEKDNCHTIFPVYGIKKQPNS